MIVEPQGALWLHQHKGNPVTSSAFLLKHNSPHLASWHHIFSLLLGHPLPQLSFSLPGQNRAIITLFYFSPSLQCTTFNPYLSIFCLMSFLFSFAFLLFFWLPRSDRTNNATGVSLNVATHHCSWGCLGNALTINFQLKQTKRWQLRVHGTCQEAVLI